MGRTQPKLWQGRENDVIAAYLGGKRNTVILREFNISLGTLYAVLHRHGVPLHGKPAAIKYDHQAIIADVQAGMTDKELVAKHNLSQREVLAPILKKHGIPQVRKGGNKPLSMKPFNPGFFEQEIDATAYWAGFLMADGSLGKEKDSNSWSLSLSLHERDIDHLSAFCDAIKVDRSFVQTSISRYKTTESPMKSITVYHPSLPVSLARWGIVLRKTYNFVAPDVPAPLMPAYLRGWADGDGHIRWGIRSPQFGVTGNYQGLIWYRDALRQLGFTGNITVKQAEGKAWGRLIIHSTARVMEIAELLQVRTGFHLSRKWEAVLKG